MHVLAITPELPHADSPGSMAPAARQIQSLRDEGIEVTTIDMRGRPMVKYLLAIPKIRRQLASVDLVHGHFGYCGWLARMQRRKPVVLSFMGDDLLGTPRSDGSLEWFSRQMVKANKRLATMVNQVIVKSPEMATAIAPTKCHVVPNGVDTELFRPIDQVRARHELGWSPDETVLLFPGNPANPRKGFPLAQAATKIVEQTLGRPIRLAALWNIHPDQVPLLMNAADAVWMTSVIEGSPNVVKEALACDRPVVAVPVGDVEWLLSGVAACHVCERNPQDLGATMAQILATCPQPGGRQSILDRALDLPAVARRIITVYEAALRQGIRVNDSTLVAQTSPQPAVCTSAGGP